MDLLRALAMPFRPASLLFVGLTALFLDFVLGAGVLGLVLGLFGIVVTVVSLTRYAYRMIEDTADGVRDAAVVDVDMFNPVGDTRCWVHPALGLGLAVMHALRPQWPVAPTLIGAALLLPPSMAAMVISGRARDALNPAAIGVVVRDLGGWYPLVVLATALCAALSALLVGWLQGGWLMIASLELLLLLACACIGTAIYVRRIELGFAARLGPERKAAIAVTQREARRQQMLDAVYGDLRARETPRALAHARQWLLSASTADLPADAHEILAATRSWDAPRELPHLLRGFVPVLLELRQPALAWEATEIGLAANSGFAPDDESAVEALAAYALRTGRRRAAIRLVENFMQALPAGSAPTPRLAQLRESLGPLR